MSESVDAPAGQIRFGTPAGRWLITAMVLGSGVVSLDATVVNVALPRMARDLGADFAELQWVVNSYTLTLAALILIGGSLGDHFGRRRVFVVGTVWFMAASALCGLAPTVELVIAARALQGVGGALLTPGSLAILQASFHPQDRARAIGAWSGFAGVTTAIGPFVGGYLIDAASWRWVFLLNLPLGLVVVWITSRHVPESRDPGASRSLDYTGAVTGALGLAGITWGLIERSWPIGIAGAILLVLFVVVERRSSKPMLPLGIFESSQFTSANIVTFFVYAGLGAVLFMIGLVLQVSMGYSPLEAGASLIPITIIMLTFSAKSGQLAQRIGPRWQMTFGPFTIALGLFMMTRVEPGRGYVTGVLPAVIVFASGLALTVAPLTATVLAAAGAEHSGIASGVNNAVARVGGLLAVAAVPLVAGFSPTGEVSAAELVDGFHITVVAAAVLVVIGGVVAWIGIRSNVLATSTPDDSTPIAERRPCYHCGSDAPPLAVHGGPPEVPPQGG